MTCVTNGITTGIMKFDKIANFVIRSFHSAFEGHLRGSMILNFHVLVGFYMLVRGFPEDIGPQLPQILAQ